MTVRNHDGLGDIVCEKERAGVPRGQASPWHQAGGESSRPTDPRSCSELIFETDYQDDNQVNGEAY